jgi:hypothetical protein
VEISRERRVDAAGFPLICTVMRLPRTALAAFGLAALLAPGASGGEFVLFRSIWGEAIVNTDMTPAGRELTPPTPDHPVYYVGRSLAAKLGSIPGDQEPPVPDVNALAAKLLAKQGYLPAGPGHEPTLFLVVQWGHLKPGKDDLGWFMGYGKVNDIAAPSTPIIGALLWNMRSRDVETIVDYASDPLYGIIVTAFDHASARTANPVALWQTRIALPALGKSMADALPTMFIAGAPYFGRETDRPTLRDADTVREGHVKFGDTKFLEDLPPAGKTQ